MTTDPRGDYDVLHVHWVGPRALYYARRAHRRGRAVVLSVHTPPELILGSFTCSGVIARAYARYLRSFIRHVDLVIVPSLVARESLVPLARGRPVEVVSSGVDLERFRYSEAKRESFRRRYGLTGPTVLSVGQVIPRKGVETFLEVARRLPEVRFLWVGPRLSPLLFYSARFERLLRRRPENVCFAGFIREIEDAYSGCDLLFHPAHDESLGLVILEGAAAGLPLVVRRLPVYRGWLEEGAHCRMGKSCDEFVRAIGDSLNGRRLRLAAEDLVEDHALARVGATLVAAYRKAL